MWLAALPGCFWVYVRVGFCGRDMAMALGVPSRDVTMGSGGCFGIGSRV